MLTKICASQVKISLIRLLRMMVRPLCPSGCKAGRQAGLGSVARLLEGASTKLRSYADLTALVAAMAELKDSGLHVLMGDCEAVAALIEEAARGVRISP